MSYTEGVRKLFNSTLCIAGTSLSEAGDKARKAGHRLMNFNEKVYFLSAVTKEWEITPLEVQDFEV